MAERDRRPCMMQGSAAPVFRLIDEGGEDLRCGGCARSILIEHYLPDNFVGIRIKCFMCGVITETPGLPPGEILPQRVITLGADGSFMLASTCDVPAKAVFTCDQEIEREQVLTRPRPNGGGGALLPLSEARIASVEVDYDKLTGGHFQRQSASRRRGDVVRDAEEFPVAWACGHLRRRLAQGMPTLSNDAADAAALLCAANLRRLVAVWGHHPRFTVLGQTFRGAKSFHHNAALFAVADYLFQQGNRIGLAIPIGNGARTPDLYTRIGRAGKLHVEVKAPQALHWPGPTASDVQTITAIVKKQLHGSRGQLSRRQRGVLVISTGITDPGFGDRLQAGIAQALASKGYNYRGVAAIVGMAPLATFPFELSGLGCRMIPVRNPAYDGVNPVGL